MVDLKRQAIVLGKEYQIYAFKVWWYVEGMGLYPDLAQAMLTERPIQSVAVALTADPDIYEVLP